MVLTHNGEEHDHGADQDLGEHAGSKPDHQQRRDRHKRHSLAGDKVWGEYPLQGAGFGHGVSD
jgi:hypothetical protein